MPGNGKGEPYDRYIVGEGLYNVTIKEENEIVFYGLEVNRPGFYRIESWAEDIDTYLGDYYANDFYVPETTTDGDDNSGENLNFSYVVEFKKSNFIIEYDDLGNEIYTLGSRWTFGFSVKDVSEFPCTFPVVFYRISDSKEEPKPQIKTVKVSEELNKYADQTGTLTSCKMDGSDVAVYNESDRFYHLGNENGPVIVTKISLPCEYIDVSFAAIENSGNSALTLLYTYNYSDFIASYAENTNSHGVYPVTEELRLFLDRFQETHNYFGSSGWVEGQLSYKPVKNYYWMFAAYYYAD